MEAILRATVIFFFLFVMTRGVGRRELSQMTAFELLVLVTLGDLVQQGVTQEDMSLTGAMLAVGTMSFWSLLFAYAAFRFPRTRATLEGSPLLVVRDGRVLDDVLRAEGITTDELLGAARNQGIADVGAVRFGVLEPDGKMSFVGPDADQQGDDPKDHVAT